MKLIYVADDDKNICNLLKNHIESNGYKVEVFSNGNDLLNRFNKLPSDMIITDIIMPKMNGYDLCKEIRKISQIPFFMISANNDEIDRILGLELGSDDYISKPISFRELLIKIRNTFKKLDSYIIKDEKDIIICKDLKICKKNRTIYIKNDILKATTKEFDLLLLFLENKNRAYSRENIISLVWGYDFLGDSRQVDHLIKRLRKKMILCNSECQIETVWGYGYKIGENIEK